MTIFDTDQGSQFTTHRFTQPLLDKSIQVSMDGRGRALVNIFVERLWQSGKYEKVYLNDFETVKQAYLVSISVENFPPVSVQKFPHGLVG